MPPHDAKDRGCILWSVWSLGILVLPAFSDSSVGNHLVYAKHPIQSTITEGEWNRVTKNILWDFDWGVLYLKY